MKFSFHALVGAILMISLNLSAGAILSSENIVTVVNPPKTNEVFVPPGFDDLDTAEITFVNHSKTSCFIKNYVLNPKVDQENRVIRISNMSMVMKGDFCKSRDIPTPTTLKLGELHVGTYQVEFETQDGQFEKYTELTIHKSKSDQVDDFEYAPLDINNLTVKVDREQKQIIVSMPGTFPNGCYRFNEVVVVDNRSATVIEVLPIVEMTTNVCTQEIQFFDRKVVIPYDVQGPVKKLIHIRSADGVAINRVVTLE